MACPHTEKAVLLGLTGQSAHHVDGLMVKLGWPVLLNPVTDGEECLCKMSCFVVMRDSLYISNLLSLFEMKAFCSLSAALTDVRMTQHCLPARQRVIACRVSSEKT